MYLWVILLVVGRCGRPSGNQRAPSPPPHDPFLPTHTHTYNPDRTHTSHTQSRQTDDFKMKLCRNAVIGFSASAISDTVSNSVRVVKVRT